MGQRHDQSPPKNGAEAERGHVGLLVRNGHSAHQASPQLWQESSNTRPKWRRGWMPLKVVVQTLHLTYGKLCLQDGAHRKRTVFIVCDYKDSHVCLAADHAAVNKSFLQVTTQKVWPTAINVTGGRGKTNLASWICLEHLLVIWPSCAAAILTSVRRG